MSSSSPSLEILVREAEGFCVWNGPPFSNGQPTLKLERVSCSNTKFSVDGSKLMAIKSDGIISIYNSSSLTELRSFTIANVTAAELSPCGTYLQTFQKPTTPQEKNVSVWNIETGDLAHSHYQKSITKTTWPSIRFCPDESSACRLATNEVQFFDPKDFSKGITSRIRVPGVAAFELSKTPASHVAVFVPESKGSPGSVQIFGCGKDLQSQPSARRSFFRCSSVQFSWNHGSTGLLVVVQSDVDKTNQSYYGETKLHYLTIDGTHEGLVPLRKEGPVHDVQWSFSGSEFAVVYGFMPACVTIFDKNCKPLMELGEGPYNTLRWNPKGRVLCVAGFGNLPGDMAFWDVVNKKQLGSNKAEWSVTSEWSPDGRYFLTASTAPRRQIDNGMKIFNYDGKRYFKKAFEKLYQAEWKPVSPDRFGEISELIKSVESLKLGEGKSQGQGSAQKKAIVPNTIAKKPAAYQPPHAKHAAAIQAELLGVNTAGEMSKNALRNKKKREKKKAAEAAASGANNA
ncbi:PREDICTED: eukaryotic translation initiation factor 2A-like [Camelina sativa]|uniref:Eukaryotic translation initiation factor 2A n=1 Tax=Camelina sativa TaxID=90675 RepID=A0ABM1Q991_CAMSA|nr:PREDICTED: eukaryotic translation initiation factor 2A-like [Camelina sativa]